MDKHAQSSNRYQVFRRGVFLGSVIAYPDYENRSFYTVSTYHHGELQFSSGDVFINYKNVKFYITNVERIKYSYKLSFETDEDRNRYKRPSSWINILTVKTASLKELEELIPFVSQSDQPLLKELIQVLKKSVSEGAPLSQNKLNKYKGMLKRNNRVMAKLAELLLKYLIG
ncbi:hypothetical protein [Lentilactobacillus hilgardii]|uniref:hypothetical protein n=1 Tax=Lentilactobacillus hilgardii TaxID=1588 RepID=UPI00019C5BE8|nr:hypothetical protein [Lentilactobacillus hilgardii]EEI19596.1 hypothetical protein HMPREF0497_1581 [Lentilactobacillus buchneri ATCC 11577]MCP9333409.1 hypothetical protein [Lentilactobacillus hilgardii]MCP9350034.1 hypothetical protein [Lentilactobacillus hilgardii]MCP9352566.1 hypothetical protein [Lentilactobacillus hilgardii]QIR10417.1 hypothetical protein G8J22_02425 [Lentilactobacillus hilgardii]